MREVWKDIKGYEGCYQVSNLGRVKNLRRPVWNGSNFHTIKERFLKFGSCTGGYNTVKLCVYGTKKDCTVHTLVAIAFLNHIPCGYNIVVDHINNLPTDNRLSNLQLITQRENASKDRKGGSSKYVGVYWDRHSFNWKCKIQVNKKIEYLGIFKSELLAHKAYQKRLNEIK